MSVSRPRRWMLSLLALVLLVVLWGFAPTDLPWALSGEGQGQHWLGRAGALVSWLLFWLFGYGAYLLPISLLYFARCEWLGRHWEGEVMILRVTGLVTTLVSFCALASTCLRPIQSVGSGGGIVGDTVYSPVHYGSSFLGDYQLVTMVVVLLVLTLLALNLATGKSLLQLVDDLGGLVLNGLSTIASWLPGQTNKLLVEEIPPPKKIKQPKKRSAQDFQEPSFDLIKESLVKKSAQRRQPTISEWADPSSDPQPQIADTEAPLAAVPAMPDPQPTTLVENQPKSLSMPTKPVATVKSSAEPEPEPEPDLPWPLEDDAPQSFDEFSDSLPPAPESPVVKSNPKPPVTASAAKPIRRSWHVPHELSPLPSLDLLDEPEHQDQGYSEQQLQIMADRVEVLLQHFGISVTVKSVDPGPVITRFEIDPAPGVKVSQVSNLAKDLARGLSVISVRVVEVIPGKSYMGLEIPNRHRHTVFLREILDSSVYQDSNASLTLAMGKDIAGKPVVANLAKMPHLLVAGTTGSGKSVAVNAMLLSLLYKARPEQVRLILVDPKMLELSIYEDIPHLLAPVVTDMKEAANALRWCVAEMERRYHQMAGLKVRNIAAFNRRVKEAIEAGEPLLDPLGKDEQADQLLETLPYIVVVIDELADMMMMVGKKVEELIARLAQKARAAGIHLILATQRPSVDVITGLIKANIPTRVAFQVSSRVDSRTILDQMGAEQLLGSGDMLYLPPGTAFPKRLHGAFVDDNEVNRVVDFLRKTGEPDYIEDVLEETNEPNSDNMTRDSGQSDVDPLYDEAVRIVTETRRASISGVQRRLKVGYNRAARMIEEMEAVGIVSSVQGNGTREVVAPPPPEA